MKLLKNICVVVAIGGFILAYGTAGTSDLEMETGRILMTDAQFYVRMITSGLMLVCGSISVTPMVILAVVWGIGFAVLASRFIICYCQYIKRSSVRTNG